MDYNELSKFTRADKDKKRLIDQIFDVYEDASLKLKKISLHSVEFNECMDDAVYLSRFCPKCKRKYPERENFCLECAVALKDIRYVNVRDLELNPSFTVEGKNLFDDFNEILTPENLDKIAVDDFDIDEVTKNIRMTAIRRLDSTIKDNDILLDDLSVLEKIILFVKSFVDVEYKSYGRELGYYEFKKIHIDDRQLDALQITTLLHELTHFLNMEILSEILCQILDCTKTSMIESVTTFILSYSDITRLVDEYAAHTVEGRFTLYGFQDYSSFLSIQSSMDLPDEEIEMLKTIANTLANIIKDILESFIDADLLDKIKKQFKSDIMDRPDYKNLALENCTLLNMEGLIRAVRFILHDGFAVAMDNTDILEQYNINLEKSNEY